MSEQNKPFVVTDRRKFTLDGEPRPDADPSPEREPRLDSQASLVPSSAPAASVPASQPASAPPQPSEIHEVPPSSGLADSDLADSELPPPPTAIEMEQAKAAYQQTSERLDTAVRAANPGAERPPAVSFEQIVQSIYMTAIMQLGGGTPEGQQPKIDLMGARQSVDMLTILADKTKGNLTPPESQMMDNALFELRMGFLEVTQALARSAARTQPGPPPAPGRPTIVR
jgi:Domain of unknown function (DUF1844)